MTADSQGATSAGGRAREVIEERIALGQLPRLDADSIEATYIPLCQSLAEAAKVAERPQVVAIVGAPGSGKTTLSTYFQVLLPEVFGLSVAGFSLDDLYLNRADREQLARNVHPLFATRGAPGTHRIELGMRTLQSLRHAAAQTSTPLPRFNKGLDEPRPESEWPVFVGRPDVILIDSWLWNVNPPTPEQLTEPYNERERKADAHGTWRQAATQALGRDYPEFFSQAKQWVLLETPDWETTVRFREEQEEGNRSSLPSAEDSARDEASSIRHFLDLFQRWAHLPHTSEPDFQIRLDHLHRATFVAQDTAFD